MKHTIFLCASMHFYRELVEIEKELEAKGFIVHIPVSAQLMKEQNNFEVTQFKSFQTNKQKAQCIRTNFQTIAKSDSILVVNNEKNGIKGYIGPNVLMEIGLAFYCKKKIYIWNSLEENAGCKEELKTFGVEFINRDVNKV